MRGEGRSDQVHTHIQLSNTQPHPQIDIQGGPITNTLERKTSTSQHSTWTSAGFWSPSAMWNNYPRDTSAGAHSMKHKNSLEGRRGDMKFKLWERGLLSLWVGGLQLERRSRHSPVLGLSGFREPTTPACKQIRNNHWAVQWEQQPVLRAAQWTPRWDAHIWTARLTAVLVLDAKVDSRTWLCAVLLMRAGDSSHYSTPTPSFPDNLAHSQSPRVSVHATLSTWNAPRPHAQQDKYCSSLGLSSSPHLLHMRV